MTAAEAYELTTQGGATDFAHVISVCQTHASWCLIGDFALHVYDEPVYTLDAALVVVAPGMERFAGLLIERGFALEEHPHSLYAQMPGSQLRIQFTTDPRYQAFPDRAVDAVVLDVPVKVACLEDVTQGKLWAYSDPDRRFSKRKKDELI